MSRWDYDAIGGWVSGVMVGWWDGRMGPWG